VVFAVSHLLDGVVSMESQYGTECPSPGKDFWGNPIRCRTSTTEIDLQYTYDITHVVLSGAYFAHTRNTIYSMSDSRDGQSYTSCTNGISNACGVSTNTVNFRDEQIDCTIPATGRFLCIRSLSAFMILLELKVFATKCECAEGSYSIEDQQYCELCPDNTNSAANSTSLMDCLCNAGWSGPISTCTRCVPGKFKDVPGSHACIDCPVGKYSYFVGASMKEECSECASGWSNVSGDCVGCVPGKYKRSIGSEVCTDCAPGKYNPYVNSSTDTCSDCEEAKYSAENKSQCLLCPANTTSTTGSDSFIACTCRAGWTGTSHACVGCVAGKFKIDHGSHPCTNCSDCWFSDLVNSYTDNCKECATNTYSAENRTQCVSCPSLTTSVAGSASITNCTSSCKCGKKGFCASVDVAQMCGPNGTASPCNVYAMDILASDDVNALLDGVIPQDPSISTYNTLCRNKIGQNWAICGSPSSTTTVIDLKRSYHLSHVQLWAGKSAGNIEGSVLSMSDTMNGHDMYHCSSNEQKVCSSEITPLVYQERSCKDDTSGRYFCISTPRAYFSANEIKLFAWLCSCEAGSYSTNSRQHCEDCPLHSTSAVGSNSIDDCSCKAGFSGRTDNCSGCVPGKYKTNIGSHGCTDCVVGKYTDLRGALSEYKCSECAVGYAETNGECIGCVSGKYKNEYGSHACTSCADGKFSIVVNASSDTCRNCDAGSYSIENNSKCLMCAENSHSSVGSGSIINCSCNAGWSGMLDNCLGCVAGKYKRDPGSMACTSCGAGKWSFLVNASTDTCRSCTAGSILTHVNSTSNTCIDCVAGSYSNENRTACLTCPQNSFSPVRSDNITACLCNAG